MVIEQPSRTDSHRRFHHIVLECCPNVDHENQMRQPGQRRLDVIFQVARVCHHLQCPADLLLNNHPTVKKDIWFNA